MTSIFTSIIKGELPSHSLWRDELCVSFLSINPLTTGHSLIVPHEEKDHWLDLPTETIKHLMHVASLIGKAQMEVFKPLRIGQIIAGFEVPHTHLHVLPVWTMRDLEFSQNPQTADQSDLAETAKILRSVLLSNGHEQVAESFA
ncbi:MAG: HIT family protein [Acidimicrobiales bacterium]|jgi:histidine triad (HIT) family protein|nr:HIT family protein [Acidimicrobiales bacterium]MDP6299036.1 HIT family protein [Acidimicrobiales bacterium]HJM28774.1 HIT family protein [Acidimicrobiales bacterium]HJM98511.1 HIT family protein [Acidimicrobiales bacterium]